MTYTLVLITDATVCSVKEVVLPGLTFKGAGEDGGGERPDRSGAVYRRRARGGGEGGSSRGLGFGAR